MDLLSPFSSPRAFFCPSPPRERQIPFYSGALEHQTFPALWKVEYVTPLNKVESVTSFTQLRKISSTSDYSKIFEAILKDYILEDLESKIDKSQYGSRKGVGTEHLIVRFVDRILQLLESAQGRKAVISAAVDWDSAFDQIDPTIAISKFLSLGIRATLIPILISYLK